MATKGDIKQAVYDECRAVLSTISTISVPHGDSFASVSNVDAHVGIAREREGDVYPYIAFEEFSRVKNIGMGSHPYVDERTYSGGSLDSITFRKDEIAQYDIYVEVDGSEGQKDALYEALKSQFEQYLELKDVEDVHPDIDSLELQDTRGADRMEDGVRGDRLRLVVDYGRFETYTSIPTMETIELDFEIDGSDVSEIDFDVLN